MNEGQEIFDAQPVPGKPNEFAVTGAVSPETTVKKPESAKDRWQKANPEVVTVLNERSKTLASPEMQTKLFQFKNEVTRAVTETTPRPASHFATDDMDQLATDEQDRIAEQIYQARVKDRTEQLLGYQSIRESEITNMVEHTIGRKIDRSADADRKLLTQAEKDFESTRTDYHDAQELAKNQLKQLP